MKLLQGILAKFKKPARPLTLGQRGEIAAAKFLKRKRYLIIATGERTKSAEVDIIAVDVCAERRTIVFVEVKTRTSTNKGHPADAVNEGKQRKITRGAETYIRKHDLQGHPVRFDIVSILWPDITEKPQIDHYVSAFEAVTGEWD